MTQHRYDDPPTDIGGFRSFRAGSGREVHVRRYFDQTLGMLDPQNGARVARIIDQGDAGYTLDPEGAGIPRIDAPISWEALLDSL